MEEVLMSTASFTLTKRKSDDELIIEYISFPMPKFANHVGKRVILNSKESTVKFVVFHDGWGCGCGSLTGHHVMASVQLPDEQFQQIYAQTERINSPDDLENLIEKIEQLQREIDEEIEKELEELQNALIQLQVSKEVLELLRDREKVKEILESYVGDC